MARVSLEGVNEVRVTRPGDDGQVVLSYDRLVAEGWGNLNVAGGDVVYVPEGLVYVMGQVKEPGPVAFREQMTLTRCLAASGGATEMFSADAPSGIKRTPTTTISRFMGKFRGCILGPPD